MVMALLGHSNNKIVASPSTVTAPMTAQAPARITINAAEVAAMSEEEWVRLVYQSQVVPPDPDITASLETRGTLPTNKHVDAGSRSALVTDVKEKDASARQAAVTPFTERCRRASLPRPVNSDACASIEAVNDATLLPVQRDGQA
jgi:hypothetical protein